MKAFICSLLLFVMLFLQTGVSETIIIQDCDDITLGNVARANNGYLYNKKAPDCKKIIIDKWRC